MELEINEISMTAPINKLSFGNWSYNILKELHKREIRVNLFPLGNLEYEPTWVDDIQKALHGQEDFSPAAPSLKVWHPWGFHDRVGHSQHVGATIFELDTLNNRERHHLMNLDKILVPTDWGKSVIVDQLATTQCPKSYVEKNTFVVPLGVDPDIFSPAASMPFKTDTVFLNCGKWEKRKGADVLLEAFNQAFEPSDNVQLWMAPFNPFIDNNPWVKLYKESKLGDKISILDRVDTQAQIVELYNYVDCGIFPARAEGWGLCAHEMMACGKLTIVSNCTGHTQFVTPESNLLIDMGEYEYGGPCYSFATYPKDMEPAFDAPFFTGNGCWMKFGDRQMEQLITHMRNVHKKVCGLKQIEKNAVEQARKFTWKHSVDKLLEALSVNIRK